MAAYGPLVQHWTRVLLIAAAGLEQAGTWVMWTYYGAYYVERHAFNTRQVGWVSLAGGLLFSLARQRREDGSAGDRTCSLSQAAPVPARSSACR
jgi:hypothetical protein